MFIKNEIAYIRSNYEEIEALIQKHVNRSFGQTGFETVGMICICFMHTSLCMGKPVFRLCFYPEDTVWENPILEYEMPADWLFHEWSYEMKSEQELIEARKQIRPLLIYTSAVFKYALAQCYKFSNYNKMKKADELFICFGEFKDWQYPIYIDRPEVDIFNKKDEDVLTFRRFENKVYKNKKFEDLNLTSSVFTHCDFRNVEFNNVDLTDVIFENCKFYNATFTNSKLYGTTHRSCDLKQISYISTQFTPDNVTPENITGIYRECMFIGCKQEAIQYENSDTERLVVV